MRKIIDENGIEGIDFITCKICSEKLTQLNHRHLLSHDISSKDYKIKFNVESLTCKKYSRSRENTFFNKYGAKNQFGRKDVRIDKLKQSVNHKKSILEKYGIENISQLKEVKDKKRINCFEKYGYDCNLAAQNKQKSYDIYSKKMNETDIEKIKQYRLFELKIYKNMSGYIRSIIKIEKTFKDLPYSRDELINHLISTTPEGFKWQDYLDRKLQLDHIIPVSVYYYKSAEDEEFIKCWSLRNLRLCEAMENRSKSDHIDYELIKKHNIFDLLPAYMIGTLYSQRQPVEAVTQE